MSYKSKKNITNTHSNSKSKTKTLNKNNPKNFLHKFPIDVTTQTSHKSHASSKPVPHSRCTINRKTQLPSQTQESLQHSTWQKRNPISNIKATAPYNEFNSFYSESSTDEIFNELTMILKSESQLDIITHPTDYKIRGRKFIKNIQCEFQIQMFYTTSKHKQYPNHILVEFQRRNGDGFVYQKFLNNIFIELQKTKIIKFTQFNVYSNGLSAQPITMDEQDEKTMQNDSGKIQLQMDYNTLKMLLNALFNSDCNMRRSAATYLANNIMDNKLLIRDIIKIEPMIIMKFSDLLLKCVDPELVQCIGCILYYMLIQSNDLKVKAIQSNVKNVCRKVYKRWTEPIETRYGTNNKYVIRVIPSMQVAQRMNMCIQVLE